MHIAPLIDLMFIWSAVLIATWLARRTRLTPVLWYLFMGAALTNTKLLPAEPLPFIGGLAELGVIFIMFALGFEESTENFIRSVRRSWGIALFGAIAPFLAAWSLALWFWGDQRMALVCGLAMTATAVSLTMVSLRSERLLNTPVARAIMASAVLDDVGTLVLVAVLVPIVIGAEPLSLVGLALTIAKVALFFGIVTAASAWLFPHDIRQGWAGRVPLLRKYGIHHLIHMEEGMHATLVMLLVALLMGLTGHLLGFHPAVGAYMAGLILREEYFHWPGDSLNARYHKTKQVIDDVAFTLVGPVFFVTLGGRLLFDAGLAASILDKAFVLYLALFVAQVASAGLAARYTGRFEWPESVMIGFGMLGRAELAMVVLGIAYVQNPVITIEVFYTLMLTATLLNCTVPVVVRLWRTRLPGD